MEECSHRIQAIVPFMSASSETVSHHQDVQKLFGSGSKDALHFIFQSLMRPNNTEHHQQGQCKEVVGRLVSNN